MPRTHEWAVQSFLETGYQTPLPCYHCITKNSETEDAFPSGIPISGAVCCSINFQQEEDMGKKQHLEFFLHKLRLSNQIFCVVDRNVKTWLVQLSVHSLSTLLFGLFLYRIFLSELKFTLNEWKPKLNAAFMLSSAERGWKGKKKMLLNKL